MAKWTKGPEKNPSAIFSFFLSIPTENIYGGGISEKKEDGRHRPGRRPDSCFFVPCFVLFYLILLLVVECRFLFCSVKDLGLKFLRRIRRDVSQLKEAIVPGSADKSGTRQGKKTQKKKSQRMHDRKAVRVRQRNKQKQQGRLDL